MHGKLKNANASDIMNKSVVTVKEEENIGQVAKIMAEQRIGSVIVENDSNEPKGIITESDVIRSIAKSGKNFFSMKAVNVMSSPLITIIPSMDVEKVEKEMKRRNVKHLPVVISGRLVGIVTSIDVVTYLGKWEGHD